MQSVHVRTRNSNHSRYYGTALSTTVPLCCFALFCHQNHPILAMSSRVPSSFNFTDPEDDWASLSNLSVSGPGTTVGAAPSGRTTPIQQGDYLPAHGGSAPSGGGGGVFTSHASASSARPPFFPLPAPSGAPGLGMPPPGMPGSATSAPVCLSTTASSVSSDGEYNAFSFVGGLIAGGGFQEKFMDIPCVKLRSKTLLGVCGYVKVLHQTL